MVANTNPILAELWRGPGVESVHRGAWVMVDTDGNVIDGRGDPDQLIYARSSTKSIQALPLIESGAADDLGITEEGIAVAISSHSGQQIHIDAASDILTAAGLSEDHLQCGPQQPAGSAIDAAERRIINNCSGKHAGFLAAALALGDEPADYLAPTSAVQIAAREAILAMTGADPATVSTAIDGCSAPTFRLPLRALATGLARMANPEHLTPRREEACRRIVQAAGRHPELVGGDVVPRFDTTIMRVTHGRVFAKGGAEAVQTIGVVGEKVGFAAKIDDGSTRSLHRLTIEVLQKAGYLDDREVGALEQWSDPARYNRDGVEIGRHQLV